MDVPLLILKTRVSRCATINHKPPRIMPLEIPAIYFVYQLVSILVVLLLFSLHLKWAFYQIVRIGKISDSGFLAKYIAALLIIILPILGPWVAKVLMDVEESKKVSGE